MSDPVDAEPHGDDTQVEVEAKAAVSQVDHAYDLDVKAEVADYKADAIAAEDAEHNMTVLEAVRAYPMASFWAFVISFTIIMESYDVFLINSFVALKSFKAQYGVLSNVLVNGKMTQEYVIVTKWQSALQVSGQLGALIGVFLAGPLTSRIGYRYAFITGLMLLNVFIFSFYFAESMPVIFVAQLLEGIPWGIFIANAPAYCSEIVPIKLRAPATQMLQMFWAIGSIIVGAVCYVYENVDGPHGYKIPIALQWIFPTPLAILIFCAPESPWWLVRKGRLEAAAKSVERLGRRSRLNSSETVAMMRRVVEMEKTEKEPSIVELFKGTDLYRTLIVCGVYAAQNLTGNLIANQAVYFFQQAGVSDKLAFALGLITSALQMIFVMLSWILTTYFGRRDIYLWGSLVNTVLLVALGVAGSVGTSAASNYATASLGLIISVLFTLGPAPASWVIIGETSAIRLRPLTTGMGRASYYIVEIPCIFLGSYMLNPTGGHLAGKCGYVWGATGLVCLVTAYFFLPEMKGRSYREIDILFNRHVPARKWKETEVDVQDDE
ncbi:general substrate transporter [Penicillium atrosanguineum]|uniref:General substrate transporter n=1 Tax=Penicillium atrosanguineum TaxID=1132637 RepID=A0A9W9PL06_9EURO|nr:Glutathione-dependent formaldehyde-activating enzyme/centromere protein V [Penicillium atrosanguineum]KAJ5118198.1 general substrate transporter [Penicillium atrosanguineum]KAJ5119241.1 general substrate transporter [Penicillium atrosanguineum]KAJ5296235.1 Glutathione-dependent formaldehyde-activating enzyme/centromere protein V [Penicillium atrosanguineum]KAJ5299006.1 general substrate transporter [Penicillium atrosanguineum]